MPRTLFVPVDGSRHLVTDARSGVGHALCGTFVDEIVQSARSS
jgi:hypothetical protein